MKMPKPFLLLLACLLQFSLMAQVQWYQSQDGNNPPPNGTFGSSIQSFTPTSFIACYLWTTRNDQNTWKISKTQINGQEKKCLFITGTTAIAEVKAGRYNTVYVLKKDFPFGQNPVYTLYKLDSNLVIKAQRDISFPNNFNIFNLGVFEIDQADNIYLAGDGQYPEGFGFNPASFVIKTDKNLSLKWSRVDSSQTSYTRLHVDRNGYVQVIADFYTFFPDVKVTRLSPQGQVIQKKTIPLDAGRFSLSSMLDEDDNLLLYGGKSIDDIKQAVYICKVSKHTGRVTYRKTYFNAPGTQLNDLQQDPQGGLYALVTMYPSSGQQCKVSRIRADNGAIQWTRSYQYRQDSCVLTKLVVQDDDRFYALGERKSRNYFSKAMAIRIRKSGQADGSFPAPDSVSFSRCHALINGMIDRDEKLIAIGNTNDLDTNSFSSSYYRSFAVRFDSRNRHQHWCEVEGKSVAEEVTDEEIVGEATDDAETAETLPHINVTVYPNPAQQSLMISLPEIKYDQAIVYTLQGIQVRQQPIRTLTTTINVNGLSNGTYLLVLQSSSTRERLTRQFVVQK